MPEQPKTEDYVDENGIRTTVEYTVNEEGKRVKVRTCALYSCFGLKTVDGADYAEN